MTRNEHIISMVRSGMSYRKVAERLGISRSAVSGVCGRAGVTMDPAHIARNKRQAKRVGKNLIRALRVDEAVRLRKQGLLYREIAKQLGYRSATGVASAISFRMEART